MASLYMAVGKVATWRLCKLGITKGESSARALSHVLGGFTTYGVRVSGWKVVGRLAFPDLASARAAETQIKRHVLRTYPVLPSDTRPLVTSVPLWTRVYARASGEWLVTPGSDEDAAAALFAAVRGAVGGELEAVRS